MADQLIADNQTVSRGVYGMSLRNALAIPEEFIAAHAARIDLAYVTGEPIAMLAEEMRFRYEHRPQRSASPRDLAVRIVRVP